MNIIDRIDQQTAAAKGASVPTFGAGDTLRVHVKVKEGEKSRVQVYEGLCIARHNNGASSSFTVRKISYGEGVERVFPLYSPVVEKLEVVRRGDVNRGKLYYLRGLTGKKARITDRAREDVAEIASAAEMPAEMVAPAAVAEQPSA